MREKLYSFSEKTLIIVKANITGQASYDVFWCRLYFFLLISVIQHNPNEWDSDCTPSCFLKKHALNTYLKILLNVWER